MSSALTTRGKSPTDPVVMIDRGILRDDVHCKNDYDLLPNEYEKSKFVAWLSAFKSYGEIERILGLPRIVVARNVKAHPDIIGFAKLTRVSVVAESCEQKAYKILESIDIDSLDNDKKAQMVRYLMAAGADANRQIRDMHREKDEEEEGTTVELIYKIKSRMKKKEIPADGGDAIDITGDVTTG